MDANYALELIIDELRDKQTTVNHQLLILTSTTPPTEEAARKRQHCIDKVTAQLNALDWAEKCVKRHLNATRKLGKLGKRGAKIA
jgi:hypothetical protein